MRGGYPADFGDLLTRMRMIAADDIGDGLVPTPVQLLRKAINEIERLRSVETKLRLTERHYQDALDHLGADWQPIDTAPVEPGHTVPSYYRFRCLLQDAQGQVFEGAGYYVKVGRATTHLTLRWQNASQRQAFPKFWMPLPAPKPDESVQNGGAA